MCRLFGLSAGTHRVHATFWLLDAPDALVDQSRANPDGTGLGTFDAAGLPLVEKAPIAAWADRAFATEARVRESSTFVAHVRHASTGGQSVANTHPFAFDDWIGAHNGVVGGLTALEEYLGEDMARVSGETDSERVLALIAREARRAGGDLTTGLERALTWVGENVPIYALNLVIAQPHRLFAVRWPQTHELWILERPGRGLDLCHASRSGTCVRCAPLSALPSVVVASERLDPDPEWRLLEPGTVTVVEPDLVVHTAIRLPEPAHPLTLAELAPHAAASQAIP